jgi:cytochrome c-type biogenesis protein CcmH
MPLSWGMRNDYIGPEKKWTWQVMADWAFWAVAIGLCGLVAVVLSQALWLAPGQAGPADADLAVYKDQMSEIARDLARGTIGDEEARRLRAEIGKRVLDADRALSRPVKPVPTGRSGLVAALVACLVLPGTLALYWSLGAPGYPDMALQARLDGLDAALAARPDQATELATLGKPRDTAVVARLQGEMAAISDPGALRVRFRQDFEAGEMLAALVVQERLIALLGPDVQSNDHANLALALVAEAEGYVSPEAEAALRESLKLDMGNELSRYMVGEMFLQGGRYDQAFRFWRPLIENGTASAPWVGSIRDRIEDVAKLAGIPYVLPDAVAAAPTAGPTADDVAAAGDKSAADRQAMIEGMVAQLSDRLASGGGPVEDWNQLIRSLVVLGRVADAQTIYDEAKVKFAGQSAELSFLKLAAVESGLTP